jgi:hypothetical protein
MSAQHASEADKYVAKAIEAAAKAMAAKERPV